MRRFRSETVLSVVAASCFLCSPAFAQEQPAAGAAPPTASSQAPQAQDPSATAPSARTPDPMRQTKALTKKLGLTPDQQSKIEPILANRIQQIQAARADTALAPKDRRAKVEGIMQTSDSSIESLLSDTQKQQYDQMKQAQREKRQAQRQSAAPPSANNPPVQ
jgi:periplasmic protein CpxP/Spy